MTEERQKLINKFQKWLDTKPNRNIIAAQCANIAEEYHAQQSSIYAVMQAKPEVCGECNILFVYDWHHQYSTCPKCGNDKPQTEQLCECGSELLKDAANDEYCGNSLCKKK